MDRSTPTQLPHYASLLSLSLITQILHHLQGCDALLQMVQDLRLPISPNQHLPSQQTGLKPPWADSNIGHGTNSHTRSVYQHQEYCKGVFLALNDTRRSLPAQSHRCNPNRRHSAGLQSQRYYLLASECDPHRQGLLPSRGNRP